MKAPTILLLIVCLRTVFSTFPSAKDCSGGSQYGLANVNVCSANCDANCCGILGGSNTLCGNQVQNIANNITIGDLLGMCATAGPGGGPVCSASAASQGDACVANLQYLKQVLAVCNLGVLGAITQLLGCMEVNGLQVSQLVACCSSDGSGDVACTGQDFCSNTANEYSGGYVNCCTVECGYYDY